MILALDVAYELQAATVGLVEFASWSAGKSQPGGCSYR